MLLDVKRLLSEDFVIVKFFFPSLTKFKASNLIKEPKLLTEK